MAPSPPAPFRAFPLLSGPHLQTVLGSLSLFGIEPRSRILRVALPDGDALALLISTPPRWRADHPAALLIHGLCGSDRSPYMVRVARRLFRRGLQVVRMNLRGCGRGQGLARNPYHSGRTEDLRAAIAAIGGEFPHSRLDVVGFSLGGNLVLKLAGEWGADAVSRVRRFIAVCPPVDLAASVKRFRVGRNRWYERRFVRELIQSVRRRERDFPDLARADLPPTLSLEEFDDRYTAPRCGFSGAQDYYERSSALGFLGGISVSTRILLSQDDPLVDSARLLEARLPSGVELHASDRGGHLGFLAAPGCRRGLRWMDHQVGEWVEEESL